MALNQGTVTVSFLLMGSRVLPNSLFSFWMALGGDSPLSFPKFRPQPDLLLPDVGDVPNSRAAEAVADVVKEHKVPPPPPKMSPV